MVRCVWVDVMNSAAASKINWTQAAQIVVTMTVLAGVLPTEYEVPVLGLAGIFMPSLTAYFRTFKTGPK